MRLPDYFHFHLGPIYLHWGHRGPHDDKPSTNGLGFLGALTLLFVGLKLTEFHRLVLVVGAGAVLGGCGRHRRAGPAGTHRLRGLSALRKIPEMARAARTPEVLTGDTA